MKKLTPFNIELMFAPDATVRQLRPTTKSDIYDGVTSNFDDDGLFSTTTFGRVGTTARDETFSYIRMNGSIIHPAIFNVLQRIKSLYADIIMGTAYARWDEELKDFIVSDMFEGETGMAFFTRHLHELDPQKNNSKKRNLYVDVLKKYQRECLMHNHLVLPAGLRDLEVDQEGREIQDEVNDLYRTLIHTSNSINLVGGKTNSPEVDTQRRTLQRTANEIYLNFKKRLDGKKGLIQTKWGGRKIVNGTRNVISSIDTTADVLNSSRAPSVDQVQIGLLQMINAFSPITINKLKSRFLDDVFVDSSQPTYLIHPKTLKLTPVNLDPSDYDKWTTTENLEKKLLAFQNTKVRNNPVKIQGYYLYLVYRTETEFKLFRNIEELPDKEKMLPYVYPITYSELFYLCNYTGWYEQYGMVVRYPISGVGSVAMLQLYLKTTTKASLLKELGDDWSTVIGEAIEYPDTDPNTSWIDSTLIPFTILKGLGADYDGDMVSVNPILSNEAREEVKRYLNSVEYILDTSGNFNASASTAIPDRVLLAFTGDPID